uniref:Uncharacterized protein n=1 Tax=Anguilla anguilla TaxID=7936 RepID=A0A0E9S207_ANGAN
MRFGLNHLNQHSLIQTGSPPRSPVELK